MQTKIKKILNIAVPILLGFGILWWMYRDFNFQRISHTLWHGMRWDWMLFSMVFGVTAQLFRGLRWRISLAPLHESPRATHCVWAVFISYAASLVIPRIGEVARCGVLNRYDGVSFPRAIGTVVTERIIDSLLILLMVFATFLLQIDVFLDFFSRTGTNLRGWLHSFTPTGWIVTALCLLVTYTFGIWFSYFLHFYLTFFCFPFTQDMGLMTALVAFVVGSIAVIVPTPNGLGPWHFAVKTVLVLYGLEATSAETFVLIVHTLQTALIPLLGVIAMIALNHSDLRRAA